MLKSFLISSSGLVLAGRNAVQICHLLNLSSGTYHSAAAYHRYLEIDLFTLLDFVPLEGKICVEPFMCFSEHPKHIQVVDAEKYLVKE